MSSVFVAMWNCCISAIGFICGMLFDFLTGFGALGLFITVIVLNLFVSFIIFGGSASGASDSVHNSKDANQNKQSGKPWGNHGRNPM